jgi:hypothetical protein
MEPLVAVSLAANIIQVLDFSKKIVSQSKDPRQVAGESASYKLPHQLFYNTFRNSLRILKRPSSRF